MIIATAGHVDHGKTALIKALTGVDTDRLPEEKSRGLSIDLGFAYQTLPDQTTLGYVDVPGHEKFIRNMLSGVGGIDLGLLVVAADDGLMPQTREHFAILDLLGIDQCVVAITKIDRVAEDRILEVRQQVEKLLGEAGRKDIPVFPICALRNQGVDALRSDLGKRARDRNARPAAGNFRMAIDRAFTLKGIGLVVTGMVLAGRANLEDTLVLSSDGTEVRIRGIRAHDKQSDQAQAGERCAINIAGRGVNEKSVHRGNWLLHSSLYVPTKRIDVELRVLDTESRSLKHWTPAHLHIGADHIAARVAVLSGGTIAAGERGLAQLVLAQDAFVVRGDRFVLRDQSAQRTIAGGYVIDPFSPKRGRARPHRIAALQAMNHRNPGDVLGHLTTLSEVGVPLSSFAVSHNLSVHQTETIVKSLSLKRVGRQPEERVFSTAQWQCLLDRTEHVVGQFHKIKPGRLGASIKDIQLSLKPHVAIEVLELAAAELLAEKCLNRRAAQFYLPSHKIEVSEFDRLLWARVATTLAPDSGSPLSLHQAAEALGVDRTVLEKSLKTAIKHGEVVLVAKNRYLPISYAERLACAAEDLVDSIAEGGFTVSEYCKQTKTGRNFGIDLLEHFDRIGFTERVGNTRKIKRPAKSVFAVNDNVS